ncbi:MAG: radical SAM family heme chaperone HemW [Agathobaculum sp.]|jgi:putative oxygen-independent coproporphyrinogen III oxidase|uniref:radical SAM family heme chaperone HemW n=1 Tax=Agathobaculum sp. TaxID=2048138 RepID=UPI003D8B116E
MSRFSYKNKPLGLYIHIPFCVSKCGYCDFYSVTDEGLKKSYVSALLTHIREYGRLCSGYTVDTVYVGGGTPTCLGPKYLGRILQEVRSKFPLADDAEITVECNPESTDKKVLDAMKKHGVNRLSFGVQSAHDEELRAIGRIHTFAQAQQAVALAREKGFANISLDLMYGLPGQTQQMFLDSVEQCLLLEPQHLSCYGLKLEPTTKMGRENPVLPDDDEQADTYLAMCGLLRDNGYEHYEISNFAKPGFRSRHNLKYWDLSEYLGLGPGAHSFMNGRRFAFARDIKAYIGGEDILRDEEEVPTFQRQGEYLMVRLRTSDGVDFLDLEKRYNIDSTPYEEAFRSLMGQELVAHRGTRWYLTEKGFLVSNSIINTVVEAGQKQMEG